MMRRILRVTGGEILIVLLAVFLTACGSSIEDANNEAGVGNGENNNEIQPSVAYPNRINIKVPNRLESYLEQSAVLDWDQDEDVDIIVARGNGKLIFLENLGDLTFRISKSFESGHSISYLGDSIVYADVNGDSYDDLILPGSVLLSNPEGNFTSVNFLAEGKDMGDALAIGDCNRDGYTDVAILYYHEERVDIYLNNEWGNLELKSSITPQRFPTNPAFGDANGDGLLDLFVGTYGSSVRIFRGNGDGTFTMFANFSPGGQPIHIAVGDFYGQIFADLITHGQLFEGDGSGSFTPLEIDVPEDGSFSPARILDINRDGFIDVVTDSSFRMGSEQGFSGIGSLADHSINDRGSSLGDLNGDGLLDIVMVNPSDFEEQVVSIWIAQPN